MSKVADILKRRMKDMNLSPDQVADYCGVNRSTVFRWLNGEIDNMKRANIASLAKILNLDPAFIVGNLDDEEDKYVPVFPNFSTPQEAVRFLLEQPMIADFGGYDLSTMSDEQIIDFANEIAGMIQFAATHHYAKRKE